MHGWGLLGVIGSGLKNGRLVHISDGVIGYRTVTGHCGLSGLVQD